MIVVLIIPCATTPTTADERESSSWAEISVAINPTITLGSEEAGKGRQEGGGVVMCEGRGREAEEIRKGWVWSGMRCEGEREEGAGGRTTE